MHQIAMDLGMTVGRLKREMGMKEFADWVAFYEMNNAEPQKPNLLDSPDALIGGFGL
jgi:hypothetical protein